MAIILQEGGVSRHRILPGLAAAWPFSTIRTERVHELVDTMVAREILYEADGRLSLGTQGERLYGRKNFFELYAVFSSPPLMRVLHGKEEVGTVQALFVSMHDRADGPLCFRLGGRAWEVGHTDWSKGVLHVRPAEHGRVPNWLGLPGVLSRTLCQAMFDVLLNPGAERQWLDAAASQELAGLRSGYESVLVEGSSTLEDTDDGATWHTFAGGAVNRLLGFALEARTHERWTAGNLSIRCRSMSGGDAHEAIRSFADFDWESTATRAATDMARGEISKFQRCLPPHAAERLLVDRLLDLEGTLQFLARTPVVRAGGGMLRVRDIDAGALVEERTPSPRYARPTLPWTLVETSDALRQAVGRLCQAAEIGLDVETTLEFGTLCLIQIASREQTYIVDPLVVADLSPLGEIFDADLPVKLIHNASFERRALATVGLSLQGVVDTLELSREVRGPDAMGGHGLAAACQRELDLVIDKTFQTSNWARRPLDCAQLEYAALDAEALLMLHDRLVAACLPRS
jgi:ATP-dependent Lhr-like helicase